MWAFFVTVQMWYCKKTSLPPFSMVCTLIYHGFTAKFWTFYVVISMVNKSTYHGKRKGKLFISLMAQLPELNPVSIAWSDWEYYYSPLDGMLVHRKITPSIMLPVPIYTPGWRETRWRKVSCLRKQHDSREQARTTDIQVESPTR